jgi:ABC-2 type transport system permease protein
MRRNPDLDIVNSKEDVHTGSETQVKVPLYPSPVNNNTSKDTFTTALALTRKTNGKQQRIIISGDADLLSNAELIRYKPSVSNFEFSTALFSWLDYGEFPVNTLRPDAKDNRVTVSTDHVAFLKIIYIYVLPGLILIFAAIFLIRRKRK